MSSTNRGGERSEADYYPTPGWCVKRLLEHPTIEIYLLIQSDTYAQQWLEPCIGDGAIVRAVEEFMKGKDDLDDIEWTGCDIRRECEAQSGVAGIYGQPFTKDLLEQAGMLGALGGDEKFDVSISNPPFSVAMDIIENSLAVAHVTIMLLRVNFLGSAERQPWFLKHKPDVYLLPNRPSFKGGGKTDSIEYAWFVWGLTEGGHFYHLALTPKEERTGVTP